MSRDPSDYEVGYKKPPKSTRFQKGRSGNPKGRPKGGSDWASITQRVFRERVRVRTPEGWKSITLYEAVLRSEAKRAFDGKTGAFAAVSKTYREAEQTAPGDQQDGPRGVLVVPGITSMEDWERMAAKHALKWAERKTTNPKIGRNTDKRVPGRGRRPVVLNISVPIRACKLAVVRRPSAHSKGRPILMSPNSNWTARKLPVRSSSTILRSARALEDGAYFSVSNVEVGRPRRPPYPARHKFLRGGYDGAKSSSGR